MSDLLDLAAGLDALRGAGAAVPITRDVVRVWGPDAVTYLQGQASQDVAALAPGEGSHTFVLEPQGKVTAWAQVVRLVHPEPALALVVPAGFGEALGARLDRFKLRTKATIRLDADVAGVAVRGEAAAGWRAAGAGAGAGAGGGAGDGADDGADDAAPGSGDTAGSLALVVPVDWPGAPGGVDLLGDAARGASGLAVAPAEALEALRIACGVAGMGAELVAGSIPAEGGAWVIDAGVSFTKGCYTGQELVARVDSRGGNVPRQVRAFELAPDGPAGHGSAGDAPAVGAVLRTRAGDEAGVLTSVARTGAGGCVALASVVRAHLDAAELAVASDWIARPI